MHLKNSEINKKIQSIKSQWILIHISQKTGNIISVIEINNINYIDQLITIDKNDYVLIFNKLLFENSNYDIDSFIKQFDFKTQNLFIYIIPEKKNPLYSYREDGQVYTFLCKREIVTNTILKLLRKNEYLLIDQLCYEVSYFLMNGKQKVDGFLAKCFSTKTQTTLNQNDENCYGIIIPHYGNYDYLKCSLNNLKPYLKNTFVGIDSNKANNKINQIVSSYPQANLFLSNLSKNGPFSIRNELVNLSNKEILVFQDSDDISCLDRIPSFINEFNSSNHDFIGSHEICIDEIEKQIRAIRYPIDVNFALKEDEHHSILFGTSAIKKESYEQVGGMSNYSRFGLDTEFVLRSTFYLKIKNIDDFLYIRRIRKDSLTTNPKTALGSKIRQEQLHQWRIDFIKIKEGEITVNDSSLKAHITHNVTLKKI